MLPVKPFIRLMKKFGAKRVSYGAAETLSKIVENKLIEIIKESSTLAEHAGRKTILLEDVRLARKKLNI